MVARMYNQTENHIAKPWIAPDKGQNCGTLGRRPRGEDKMKQLVLTKERRQRRQRGLRIRIKQRRRKGRRLSVGKVEHREGGGTRNESRSCYASLGCIHPRRWEEILVHGKQLGCVHINVHIKHLLDEGNGLVGLGAARAHRTWGWRTYPPVPEQMVM
jgi:hypothetical protein